VAVLAVIVVLITVDTRMKGGLQGGFAPGNASWVAYAPRFSGVWSGLTRTSAFRDFTKQWPAPNNNAQLHVRLTAGIRPTPLRWSTWLGRKAVVFGTDTGIGWCVKPGLLLRAAHAINVAVSTQPEQGVFRYGPYHYSWREGFLLFSTSPEVLRDALSGNEVGAADSMGRDEFYVQWQAAPSGSLVIGARDGLPVRGWFKSASQGEGEAIHPWPGEPFLQLNSSDDAVFVALTQFLRWQLSMLPEWCNSGAIIPETLPFVTAAGQTGPVSDYGLALFAPDSKESRVPEFALRFRFEADAPAPPEIAPPMKAVASGPYWYLASGESALQILSIPAESTPGVEQALTFLIQWGEAGKTFEKHLRAILEDDDSLREAIEGTGVPCTQALATLGRLQINGRREEGKVRFEGNLAQAVEKPMPQ
jgi:hypothetical protein